MFVLKYVNTKDKLSTAQIVGEVFQKSKVFVLLIQISLRVRLLKNINSKSVEG